MGTIRVLDLEERGHPPVTFAFFIFAYREYPLSTHSLTMKLDPTGLY